MNPELKPKAYKDLLVRQKGILISKLVYQLTARFPLDERFGLTAQMRRAAVPVPSHIAEGQARHGSREFLHFLSRAEGSLAELETRLLLCVELEFAGDSDVAQASRGIDELQKTLVALKGKLAVYSPLATRHPTQTDASEHARRA